MIEERKAAKDPASSQFMSKPEGAEEYENKNRQNMNLRGKTDDLGDHDEL